MAKSAKSFSILSTVFRILCKTCKIERFVKIVRQGFEYAYKSFYSSLIQDNTEQKNFWFKSNRHNVIQILYETTS